VLSIAFLTYLFLILRSMLHSIYFLGYYILYLPKIYYMALEVFKNEKMKNENICFPVYGSLSYITHIVTRETTKICIS
jgi:4-hydroxybenzoate polyprenyltransferase